MESSNTSDCDTNSYFESGHEKADSTPENINKIDEIVQTPSSDSFVGQDVETTKKFYVTKSDFCTNFNDKGSVIDQNNKDDVLQKESSLNNNSTAGSHEELTSIKSTKQSCAFIIDCFDDKNHDADVQAAKYKSMVERFQTRHRRGASMSKLENQDLMQKSQNSLTSSGTPSLKENNNTSPLHKNTNNKNNSPKDKVRMRDRSNSRIRDASKRHSWSPRSSANELQVLEKQQFNNTNLPKRNGTITSNNNHKSGKVFAHINARDLPPKGVSHVTDNRSCFVPRSTAMQMALQQVDFMCPHPPLNDYKEIYNTDGDDVSDAGTYTLDGDNYTEEQKDLMNIDRSAKAFSSFSNKLPSNIRSTRSHNVRDVNFYHEPNQSKGSIVNHSKNVPTDLIITGHIMADAYLEKIKSRVIRNMPNAKATANRLDLLNANRTVLEDRDVNTNTGCFTSVTTSGVLAKQRTLDACPKVYRNSGLSTSQIDSSEYVSGSIKKTDCGTSNLEESFTDQQKAKYRLKGLTNQQDSTIKKMNLNKTSNFSTQTPTDDMYSTIMSEVAVLQTAQSKQDWIQEWARNARARSLASDRYTSPIRKPPSNDVRMTRSCTCTGTENDLKSNDDFYKNNLKGTGHVRTKSNSAKVNYVLSENIDQLNNKVTEYNYVSDPSLSPSSIRKPLKTQTKIPSPIHSLRQRGTDYCTEKSIIQHPLLQEDENYTDHETASINNLKSNLSRSNSLKSSTHSLSPKIHAERSRESRYPNKANMDYSPRHIIAQNRQRQVLSTNSLITNNINEQYTQLLTNDENMLQQGRSRKYSLDNKLNYSEINVNESPRRTARERNPNQELNNSAFRDNYNTKLFRRSSSCATRMANSQKTNTFRPNCQNNCNELSNQEVDYKMLKNIPKMQSIKKSVSSNNFDQDTCSDYDNQLEYYINDEDDMENLNGENNIEVEDFQLESFEDANTSENCASLYNTRYNKALLMRIENSKQKANSASSIRSSRRCQSQSAPTIKTSPFATAGLIACPNTPELPRRNIKSAESRSLVHNTRQSMPRDTSLNRLAQQIPNTLILAKNQLLQSAASNVNSNGITRSAPSQRTQPRYLDISKYKPVQSNQFLRKNEAKSTLKSSNIDAMKKSPSNFCMTSTRNTSSSLRSVSSVRSSLNESRTSSATKREPSVMEAKQKEMALWKRRSKYDPLKSVAEDKRKKEESKRLNQTSRTNNSSVSTDR